MKLTLQEGQSNAPCQGFVKGTVVEACYGASIAACKEAYSRCNNFTECA